MAEKRPAGTDLTAAVKRARWDAAPGVGASNGAAVPAAGLPPAAAAAAALAAAVAAKFAPPGSVGLAGLAPGAMPGVRPPVPLAGLNPGAMPGVRPMAVAGALNPAVAAALARLPAGAPGAGAGAGAVLPPGVAAAGGLPAAAPRPAVAVNMDALEKAKKALQLQKEIQEKLRNKLPALAAKLPMPPAGPPAAAAPAPVAPPPGPSAAAAPLPPPPGPPPPQSAAAPAPGGEPGADPFFDPRMGGTGGRRSRRKANFDFVSEGRFQKEAELFRLKSQFGAAAFRKGAPRVAGPLFGHAQLPLPAAAGLRHMDANLVPLGARAAAAPGDEAATAARSREGTPVPPVLLAEPVPDVEWWDRGLLLRGKLATDVRLPGEPPLELPPQAQGQGGAAAAMDAEGPGAALQGQQEAAAQGAGGAGAAAAAAGDGSEDAGPSVLIKEARITHYVEHPVPLEPPAEAPPPPPQPLKLTQRELKKLRTQRRIAREKEKQELMRQGLLEPPKPKVRIANLARVLGTEATLDPTAIEQEVRKQMAERQAAHEDRNLARKLTPAERRDRKLRKLFGAEAAAALAEAGEGAGGAEAAPVSNALDVTCSVYRIAPRGLANPAHRFKVDVNARENHMTGLAIQSGGFAVVVVEGCNKSTKRYLKLMMRRIDWAQLPEAEALAKEEEDEEMGDAHAEERPANKCTLVWRGTVKSRAFDGFRIEKVNSAAAGRQLLADAGVGQYWDAAEGGAEGEGLPFAL